MVITQSALAVFMTLNRKYQFDHFDSEDDTDQAYAIAILILSTFSIAFYVFSLYLLCSSVNLLR